MLKLKTLLEKLSREFVLIYNDKVYTIDKNNISGIETTDNVTFSGIPKKFKLVEGESVATLEQLSLLYDEKAISCYLESINIEDYLKSISDINEEIIEYSMLNFIVNKVFPKFVEKDMLQIDVDQSSSSNPYSIKKTKTVELKNIEFDDVDTTDSLIALAKKKKKQKEVQTEIQKKIENEDEERNVEEELINEINIPKTSLEKRLETLSIVDPDDKIIILPPKNRATYEFGENIDEFVWRILSVKKVTPEYVEIEDKGQVFKFSPKEIRKVKLDSKYEIGDIVICVIPYVCAENKENSMPRERVKECEIGVVKDIAQTDFGQIIGVEWQKEDDFRSDLKGKTKDKHGLYVFGYNLMKLKDFLNLPKYKSVFAINFPDMIIFDGWVYEKTSLEDKKPKIITEINGEMCAFKKSMFAYTFFKKYNLLLEEQLKEEIFCKNNSEIIKKMLMAKSKLEDVVANMEKIKAPVYAKKLSNKSYEIILRVPPFINMNHKGEFYLFDECEVSVRVEKSGDDIVIGRPIVRGTYSHMFTGIDATNRDICMGEYDYAQRNVKTPEDKVAKKLSDARTVIVSGYDLNVMGKTSKPRVTLTYDHFKYATGVKPISKKQVLELREKGIYVTNVPDFDYVKLYEYIM